MKAINKATAVSACKELKPAKGIYINLTNTNKCLVFNAEGSNTNRIRLDLWEKLGGEDVEYNGEITYTLENNKYNYTLVKQDKKAEIIMRNIGLYFEYIGDFIFYRLNQAEYPKSYCSYSILNAINNHLTNKNV